MLTPASSFHGLGYRSRGYRAGSSLRSCGSILLTYKQAELQSLLPPKQNSIRFARSRDFQDCVDDSRNDCAREPPPHEPRLAPWAPPGPPRAAVRGGAAPGPPQPAAPRRAAGAATDRWPSPKFEARLLQVSRRALCVAVAARLPPFPPAGRPAGRGAERRRREGGRGCVRCAWEGRKGRCIAATARPSAITRRAPRPR